MPPRNETVRDRSNYFRRCCKNCAPPRPTPSLIGDSFEQVTNTYGHMYESDKIIAVRLLDTD